MNIEPLFPQEVKSEQRRPPWYEHALFWGTGGACIGIYPAAIGFGLIGQPALAHWMFTAGCLFAVVASWCVSREAKTNPKRIMAASILCAALVVSTYQLDEWSTNSSRQNGSALGTIFFQETPVLTPQRRIRITEQLKSFHQYLSALGFKRPTETPPFGVASTWGASGPQAPFSTSFMFGRPHDGFINIGEPYIDDPAVITTAYSTYLISGLISSAKSHYTDEEQRSRAERIFSEYFTWDYFDRPVISPGLSIDSQDVWVRAMWDLRAKLGRDFMNRASFCAISTLAEKSSDKAFYNKFDHYFCWYFGAHGVIPASAGDAFRFLEFQKLIKSHNDIDPGYCDLR